MYRKLQSDPSPPEEFSLPFQGQLSSTNRWVILAEMIPWQEFEQEYEKYFDPDKGAPAKQFRMALGALIIKEKLGISDRETVEQIQENPYLQYFIGLEVYQNDPPFDASMFVHFRKRITLDLINQVNRRIVEIQQKNESNGSQERKKKEESESRKNQGQLILDATCTPADIKYPTDLGLLNSARKHTEKVIDQLYEREKGKLKVKPRTYRNQARKDYLAIAKQKKPSRKKRSQALKKQLGYLKRNLKHIEELIKLGAELTFLKRRDYQLLLVIQEVYRQQLWMFENKKNSIEDRIVSLTQPHLRPIVRGKARQNTEFGAKISASYYDGFVFLDRLSWDNFNESKDLKAQVETFKDYTGHYPESVHVDQIYRNRENRAWCKERGIRISGPPLGRPKKSVSLEEKKQAQLDAKIRNEIEGKFGQGKRRFGLNLIMTKLSNTSETAIAISFLVMNLNTLFSRGYYLLFYLFLRKRNQFIVKSYLKLLRYKQI